MRNRVVRLRVWLLGSAGFLLLVIAAFLGAAHFCRARDGAAGPARREYRARDRRVHILPVVQGKTVFTIHAAKAVEHTDSKIALHDVSIALYGEKQERNDRIQGDKFKYDQKEGCVPRLGGGASQPRAAGAGGGGKGGGKDSAFGAKVLHVTTSRLVYLEEDRRGRDQ